MFFLDHTSGKKRLLLGLFLTHKWLAIKSTCLFVTLTSLCVSVSRATALSLPNMLQPKNQPESAKNALLESSLMQLVKGQPLFS